MILELDDAYNVARQYMINAGYHFDDEEDGVILRQDLEQKCYLSESDSVSESIDKIDPTLIGAAIMSDALTSWCKTEKRIIYDAIKKEYEKNT